jgi:hypothetical protein
MRLQGQAQPTAAPAESPATRGSLLRLAHRSAVRLSRSVSRRRLTDEERRNLKHVYRYNTHTAHAIVTASLGGHPRR